MGNATFTFNIIVEVPPPAPSIPDILDVAPTGKTKNIPTLKNSYKRVCHIFFAIEKKN